MQNSKPHFIPVISNKREYEFSVEQFNFRKIHVSFIDKNDYMHRILITFVICTLIHTHSLKELEKFLNRFDPTTQNWPVSLIFWHPDFVSCKILKPVWRLTSSGIPPKVWISKQAFILMPYPSMWPKQFWSVQNGFGLTKLIWTWP